MALPPFTFDRNTLGSNESFLLRFIAGRPFARAAHLKNAGHFTAIALRRDNPLCRRAAHLSRGVLGLAVDMRLVACRRWQLWVKGGRAEHVAAAASSPQTADAPAACQRGGHGPLPDVTLIPFPSSAAL